jgi:molybdenum cofactor guanylyltransferase
MQRRQFAGPGHDRMSVIISDIEKISGSTTGLILAGGQARRMGNVDKGLQKLSNRPLIEWVLEALQPQVTGLMINANRNLEDYHRYGYPVLSDQLSGYHGPLAGIATGLHACRTDYLVCVPCDSPLLPTDLVQRLYNQLQKDHAELAVAHNGERLQPVFALLDKTLAPSLDGFLGSGGRKIDQWYAQHRMSTVDFSDLPDTFLNINTPEDMVLLETRLAGTTTA